MACSTRLLALPGPLPSSPSIPPFSEVLKGFLIITRRLEAAGRAFFENFGNAVSHCEKNLTEGSNAVTDQTPPNTSSTHSKNASTKFTETAGASNKIPSIPSQNALYANFSRRLKTILEGESLYHRLGIHESASKEEIRVAYRKQVIRYHPDKLKTETAAQSPTQEQLDNQRFVDLQEAYDVLMDNNLRRQYDSALPFDDSLPDGNQVYNAETFFDVMPEFFQRNARWSVLKPVPELGDQNTPIEEVLKFYDFWMQFQSWREFTLYDEHESYDAECRSERRWLERQNEKERKKRMIAEHARIQTLIELARQHDPRYLKVVQLRKQKKYEQKKIRQKKKQEETFELPVFGSNTKPKENTPLAKVNENTENEDLIHKVRKQLLPFEAFISIEAADKLIQQFTNTQIELFYQDLLTLTAATHTTQSQNQPAVVTIQNLHSLNQNSVRFTKAEHAQNIEWDIPTFLCAHVEQMSREDSSHSDTHLSQSSSLDRKTSDNSDHWTLQELSLLAKGLQKFHGGTFNRWQLISDFIQTRTAKEVLKKSKELAAGKSLKTVILTNHLSELQKSNFEKVSKGSTSKSASKPVDPVTHSMGTEKPDADGWYPSQQKALEAALIKYPSTMHPTDRWTAIALEVEGKSKKDCLSRFRQIRSRLLSCKK